MHGGGGAAACEIANDCPPTVIVPLRAAPGLADTENPTVPLPLPEPPAVTVIQDALAEAVQEHQLPDDTEKLPVPPGLSTDWLAGDSE